MFLKTDFLEAGYLYLLAYLLPDLGLGFIFLPEAGLALYTYLSCGLKTDLTGPGFPLYSVSIWRIKIGRFKGF